MPDIEFDNFKNRNFDITKLPPWWYDVFYPWATCAHRILVVTDGSLDFNESNSGGLTEFLLALETARPGGIAPIISIAHRDDNINAASAPMKAKFTYYNAFKFENANKPSALMNGGARQYDQLWIFGRESGNTLQPGEKKVIEDFMNALGGVFATGDHSDIGSGINGDLLRIRNMRDWSGIPMNGMDRIDTTNFPTPGGAWDSNSQGDSVAQQIYPHFEEVTPGNFVVHPVLKYGTGTSFQTNVVDVLPDHPHESECWLGFNPNVPGATINAAEFPALAATGIPLAPVAVATSVSGGRISGKGPVTPRGFYAISAYDGHRVNVGRIICDATWHHFVNMNLNGAGFTGTGLRDEVPPGSGNFVPNAAYLKIQQYYRNIAEWLGPVRWCRWYIEIVFERYRYPLVEELIVIPKKPGWPELIEIGKLVQQSLDLRLGRGAAANMMKDMLAAAPDGQSFLLPDVMEKTGSSLIPPDDYLVGLIGSVAHAVFIDLPDQPQELAKKFAKQKRLHDYAEEMVTGGLKRGLTAAQSHYISLAERTIAVMKERKFDVKPPR